MAVPLSVSGVGGALPNIPNFFLGVSFLGDGNEGAGFFWKRLGLEVDFTRILAVFLLSW